ncbi:2OG-Fe(II) oxygenase [Novosphingobium sp. KCTC 2891]|uniref:prolyl hydroxylase family protein n=1 Tax=Novosphingobium sp. KCTC 2891 TaxID=2989730 RepID=UPI0022227700|nr:2OG-Fe(II) oxygenase [Novosphingobium sp. KCTC 2891]MCW1384406.1 2OG-Fe(II) oxygenase [Novosphingobium sp. KCTC 2891]
MTGTIMLPFRRAAGRDPDTPALKRIGDAVRARLDGDPAAFRIPVDGLEIYGVSGFFTEAECQRLIAIVDSVARPSPTYGEGESSGRTSYTGDVDPADPFIRMLQRRIDDLLGMEPTLGETLQGQRYAPGQEFRAHFDHFNPSQRFWDQEQARGGQRSWTAMGYLNAVEEGGATDFPKVPLNIPPQAGALLVWNNMKRDGTPNPQALHAGTPVVRGVKYVLTKWYRARPWA